MPFSDVFSTVHQLTICSKKACKQAVTGLSIDSYIYFYYFQLNATAANAYSKRTEMKFSNQEIFVRNTTIQRNYGDSTLIKMSGG